MGFAFMSLDNLLIGRHSYEDQYLEKQRYSRKHPNNALQALSSVSLGFLEPWPPPSTGRLLATQSLKVSRDAETWLAPSELRQPSEWMV